MVGMKRWNLITCLLLPMIASCALNADVAPAGSVVVRSPDGCSAPPDGTREPFRHMRSRVAKSLGDPRFRGVDLVASEDDAEQTLGGKLAYTAFDKDVEGEKVELHACVAGAWRWIDNARTGPEGRFSVSLTGERRLPIGLRDLYAFVPGDGGGVRFLAYVAPRGTSVIVTDVDGTITESEEAIFNTVLFGDDIGHQPSAPQVLAAAKRPIVYLTSRGDQYTEVTRLWLAIHGFPRGPLRLARATITAPGPKTVAFKTEAMRGLGVPVAAGIGNRASDIAAYANLGLPATHIFINLPEFATEVGDELAARKATGFDDYRELLARLPPPP